MTNLFFFVQMLDPERPLSEALQRFYDNALASYFPPGIAARGCYLIGTATTEAQQDPQVGAKLLEALRGFERAIEARLRHARTVGELDASADPAAQAMIASAVLHTIAIRSRAGESRAALKVITETAVKLICGNFRPASAARPGKRHT